MPGAVEGFAGAGATMQVEPKHSGLGVASFVIGTIVVVLMFAVFVVAGVVETSTPGGMDEESAVAMLIGLAILALFLFDLVAIGLGIAGLLQPNRKKVFAILGVVFATATILGTLFLAILGNMM